MSGKDLWELKLYAGEYSIAVNALNDERNRTLEQRADTSTLDRVLAYISEKGPGQTLKLDEAEFRTFALAMANYCDGTGLRSYLKTQENAVKGLALRIAGTANRRGVKIWDTSRYNGLIYGIPER